MADQEHAVIVGGSRFTLSTYTDLKAIGKGSYGVVVSALDPTSGGRVAIKKITPMAKHTLDAKRVLREVRIIRYLGNHENIVTLEDLHVRESEDELYIVMELMDTDLHRVLMSKQVLTEAHIRHFSIQILCGLKHLHDNRIIHRDLKPGNLLLSRDCRLRITDFGLAREIAAGCGPDTGTDDDEVAEPMTAHVVTRWYRSPELMLCPDGLYSKAVDMWSVGCIFGELLGRKTCFPGKDFVHQLNLIFDVIGAPMQQQVSHIKNSQAKKFLESQKDKRPVCFADKYPHASEASLHLLEHLLVFAPSERYTVDQALHSKFFDEADMENSLSMQFPVCDKRCQFEFESNSKFQLKELTNLIVQEVRSFKEEKRKSNPYDQHSVDLKSASPCLPTKPSSGEHSGHTTIQKKAAAGDRLTTVPKPNVLDARRGSTHASFETNAAPLHAGRTVQGAGISTAKPRPSSANMAGSNESSKIRRSTGVKQVTRPSSAHVTASVKSESKRVPSSSVNYEADKALASARAWLSAAAAAADTELDGRRAPSHSVLPVKPSSISRVQKMDSDVDVSKRAMGILRSPLREDRFKNSPKRYGVLQQCSKQADIPPPFPKNVFSAGRASSKISVGGVVGQRRPITVAKSPKFCVTSKQRGENDIPVSNVTTSRRY